LIQAPIITVTGKAYWDVGHAPKDQSNRRGHLPGYAAWEIHPVMRLDTLWKACDCTFTAQPRSDTNRKLVQTTKHQKFHHSVYVVLLENAVAKHPSILRVNPKLDPLKPGSFDFILSDKGSRRTAVDD
jgi:hypothetical protein